MTPGSKLTPTKHTPPKLTLPILTNIYLARKQFTEY